VRRRRDPFTPVKIWCRGPRSRPLQLHLLRAPLLSAEVDCVTWNSRAEPSPFVWGSTPHLAKLPQLIAPPPPQGCFEPAPRPNNRLKHVVSQLASNFLAKPPNTADGSISDECASITAKRFLLSVVKIKSARDECAVSYCFVDRNFPNLGPRARPLSGIDPQRTLQLTDTEEPSATVADRAGTKGLATIRNRRNKFRHRKPFGRHLTLSHDWAILHRDT